MNKNLHIIRKIVDLDVSDELLISLIYDMSRKLDKSFTKEIQRLQKLNNIIFDSVTRKFLRKKYYYGDIVEEEGQFKIDKCDISNENIDVALDDFLSRIKKYGTDKIIYSLRQKVEDLKIGKFSESNMTNWLSFYNNKRSKYKYSVAVLRIDQDLFEREAYDENIAINFLYNIYDKLENYRHVAVVVEGELYNKRRECITWNVIYKSSIYAENFIQYKKKFFAFDEKARKDELENFLLKRGFENAEAISTEFYSSISTGYKYEDCYISDNQRCKILIFKKIELDISKVPCPSCNSTIQRGNSYPEMFLKSWECINPSCPDRSKSGRGRRFDEFGTYRYFKLVEKNKLNVVSEETYNHWRRDIFQDGLDWTNLILSEYTWDNETIYFVNVHEVNDNRGRNIVYEDGIDILKRTSNFTYDELPIYKLFKRLASQLKINRSSNEILNKDIEIFNGDSSKILEKLAPNQIGCAITSPPYYNAREYSQWKNMIVYFIDMMINAKAVYESITTDAHYLYNIGDIVSEDNVYIASNMSKRRLQLGFLTSMVFEIIGFNLIGNIIWDKGQVQSKRNSTINLMAGYVKCINCYEHVLLFKKGKYKDNHNEVIAISPVIKINSRGENIHKHTAPFPLSIVELSRKFILENLYLLDPYLGSGTTLVWSKNNNIKGLGIEQNLEYFMLSLDNINKN